MFKARPVRQEAQVLLVQLAQLEVQDLSVLQVRPVLLELRVFKERQEVLVQPALLAQQVLQVHPEFRVHLEVQVLLVL